MFALESKKNRSLYIYSFLYNSSKIHTLIGHTAEVSSAQFNWDCSRIVTGSMDKTCKLWDTLSGK
jgi:dynein assembly factor with WDR repeat domains 1